MENRYCKNYMFKECVQTVSDLSSLYNFSELCILERLSESILSRYARELAMEQLFAWMASRITSNCLLICCRWSAWQLGLGAFNSWKVQKPAKLGMSQIVTAVFESCLWCFLTTLQHTFADFTDTSLDILFPLSQPEPELACTVSCSTCSFILRLCASSSLAELIMDCISSSDDMAARTRHEHLDSTFALLLIRNGKLCNHMEALAWHDTVRLSSKPFIVAMSYSDTVWYGEKAMQLLTFLRCIQRTATKLGNQPASGNRQRKGGTQWDRFDWTYRAGSNMFHAHLQKAWNPQKDISLRVWHFLQTWTQHKNHCVWTSFQIKGEDQSRCTECWEAPQAALNQREGKSNRSLGL